MATPDPNWSGPDDTNVKLDDINNIRESIWYTYIGGLLSAGWLVPGWNLVGNKFAVGAGFETWTITYQEVTSGVIIQILAGFNPNPYDDPGTTKITIDRRLGNGLEEWEDTNLSRCRYTINATTNVIEDVDWNSI